MPINPFLTLDELRRERQQRAFQAAQQGAMSVGPALLDYDGLATAKRRLEEDRQRRLEEAQMQRTRDARDAQMQQHTIATQDAAAARLEEDRARERGAERLQAIVAGAVSLDAAKGAAAQDPTTGMFNDDDVSKAFLDIEQLRAERKRLAEKQQAELDAARALAEQRRADAEKKGRPSGPKFDPLLEEKREKLRAEAAAARARATAPPKGAAAEDKKAQSLAAADQRLGRIGKIRDLKGQFNTGRAMSSLKDASAAFGFPVEGWAGFKSRVVDELNGYIHDMTGAGAGVEEMRRLKSVMPSPDDDDGPFLEKLAVFEERAREERAKLGTKASSASAPSPVTASAAPFSDDDRWTPED